MNGELISQKLRNGERVYGTHVLTVSNPIAAKIQHDISYDFVFMCTVHIPIDRAEVIHMQLYSVIIFSNVGYIT